MIVTYGAYPNDFKPELPQQSQPVFYPMYGICPNNKNNTTQDLIDAYEEYIKLLGEELEELAIFAYIHGWESTRVKQGEELRNKIKELKKKFE